MDKEMIINEIMKHLGIKKNADFAKMLGITPQSLCNWKKRNTFNPELIYTKCEIFNAEWLLTGEGEMLKKEEEKETSENKYIEVLEENRKLHNRNNELSAEVARLTTENLKQVGTINQLTKENVALKNNETNRKAG